MVRGKGSEAKFGLRKETGYNTVMEEKKVLDFDDETIHDE